MSPFELSAKEQANVRAAARFLRARAGGWANAAKALHVSKATAHRASTLLAFRIARLAGVGVDDVLAGRYPAPGTCPHCGQPTKAI